ncbi:MAG: NAD(+) synthase [Deltaproteobacteria bacterium]|nr:NAD(+) synthase [Deltaproteobacteria bacterium]
MVFNRDVLKINPAEELEKLSKFIVEQVNVIFRRKGVIVGLSGGIDSAMIAAVCVHALGKEKVKGLILPERESNPISSEYAFKHAKELGIEHRQIDITPTVDSVVNYKWRDDFLKQLVPEYEPGYKYNITLPTDLLERDTFSFYLLQVQMPDGEIKKKRMNLDEFRAITSFANIKIRSRMLHLYAEAERWNLLVVGTTNRTEFILGDFCKYGDGGTDIEPITHLYKNQIYQLAEYLKVIPEIINRQPSPDTFSLPVTDQEFFFRISFENLDHLLYAWEKKIPEGEAAKALDLAEDAVKRAYKDFTSKFRATAHLREGTHTFN